MFILLLTLLGIALTITVAGLLLSNPRARQSGRQSISYAARPVAVEERYVVGSRKPRAATTRTASARGSGRTTTLQRPSAPRLAGGTRKAAAIQIKESLWTRLFSATASKSLPVIGGTPWVGVVLILAAICIFSLALMRALFLNSGLILNTMMPDLATATAIAQKPVEVNFGTSGASKALKRLPQMGREQYDTDYELRIWGPSACSAASMTEVLNSYGAKHRVIDVIRVQHAQGAISPELGLLDNSGIARTLKQYGFKTVDVTRSSINRLIEIANAGRPIIVNFPPGTWSPGGHVLVVTGGNDSQIFLADSSPDNMQALSHQQFKNWWRGFAFVPIPENDPTVSGI